MSSVYGVVIKDEHCDVWVGYYNENNTVTVFNPLIDIFFDDKNIDEYDIMLVEVIRNKFGYYYHAPRLVFKLKENNKVKKIYEYLEHNIFPSEATDIFFNKLWI